MLSSSISFAQSTIKSFEVEEGNIKAIVEKFFVDYENSFDNEDTKFSGLNNYYATDNNNNKELIKTILNRKIILSQEYPDKKLKEINKELEFVYNSIHIDNNNAILISQLKKHSIITFQRIFNLENLIIIILFLNM